MSVAPAGYFSKRTTLMPAFSRDALNPSAQLSGKRSLAEMIAAVCGFGVTFFATSAIGSISNVAGGRIEKMFLYPRS